ncbi:unnamed protein product [Cyprideis torosa]|uniref:Uncharacterized protein n=1 Tax=Cyprideis torosa TaxID=163714 RepID=A0A7R8ZJ96_9CRUS|nr:unnamed protein product [Cyprideis torosa]CAG0881761.1 unnamed protein product [Cyprideis torosa]
MDCWVLFLAARRFMSLVERLRTYGVHYYRVKDRGGTSLWLGISGRGIAEYSSSDRARAAKIYFWKQLENLYFRDRKFSIEVHRPQQRALSSGNVSSAGRRLDESDQAAALSLDESLSFAGHPSAISLAPGGLSVLVFFARSQALTKTIWSMAIAQHQFYLDHKHDKLAHPASSHRALSDLASDISRSRSHLSLSSSSSQQSLSRSSLQTSGESEESLQAAKQEMYGALKARKEALEKKLADKIKALRELCNEEMQITGEVPEDYPLEEGEAPPQARKRVGTAFSIPETLLNKLKSTDSAEENIAQLELEYEIQQRITNAAQRLMNDASGKKSLKRQRRQSYEMCLKRLQLIEEKLKEARRPKPRTPQSSRSMTNIKDLISGFDTIEKLAHSPRVYRANGRCRSQDDLALSDSPTTPTNDEDEAGPEGGGNFRGRSLTPPASPGFIESSPGRNGYIPSSVYIKESKRRASQRRQNAQHSSVVRSISNGSLPQERVASGASLQSIEERQTDPAPRDQRIRAKTLRPNSQATPTHPRHQDRTDHGPESSRPGPTMDARGLYSIPRRRTSLSHQSLEQLNEILPDPPSSGGEAWSPHSSRPINADPRNNPAPPALLPHPLVSESDFKYGSLDRRRPSPRIRPPLTTLVQSRVEMGPDDSPPLRPKRTVVPPGLNATADPLPSLPFLTAHASPTRLHPQQPPPLPSRQPPTPPKNRPPSPKPPRPPPPEPELPIPPRTDRHPVSPPRPLKAPPSKATLDRSHPSSLSIATATQQRVKKGWTETSLDTGHHRSLSVATNEGDFQTLPPHPPVSPGPWHSETSKPFEMTDFYKYSTKYKRSVASNADGRPGSVMGEQFAANADSRRPVGPLSPDSSFTYDIESQSEAFKREMLSELYGNPDGLSRICADTSHDSQDRNATLQRPADGTATGTGPAVVPPGSGRTAAGPGLLLDLPIFGSSNGRPIRSSHCESTVTTTDYSSLSCSRRGSHNGDVGGESIWRGDDFGSPEEIFCVEEDDGMSATEEELWKKMGSSSVYWVRRKRRKCSFNGSRQDASVWEIHKAPPTFQLQLPSPSLDEAPSLPLANSSALQEVSSPFEVAPKVTSSPPKASKSKRVEFALHLLTRREPTGGRKHQSSSAHRRTLVPKPLNRRAEMVPAVVLSPSTTQTASLRDLQAVQSAPRNEGRRFKVRDPPRPLEEIQDFQNEGRRFKVRDPPRPLEEIQDFQNEGRRFKVRDPPRLLEEIQAPRNEERRFKVRDPPRLLEEIQAVQSAPRNEERRFKVRDPSRPLEEIQAVQSALQNEERRFKVRDPPRPLEEIQAPRNEGMRFKVRDPPRPLEEARRHKHRSNTQEETFRRGAAGRNLVNPVRHRSFRNQEQEKFHHKQGTRFSSEFAFLMLPVALLVLAAGLLLDVRQNLWQWRSSNIGKRLQKQCVHLNISRSSCSQLESQFQTLLSDPEETAQEPKILYLAVENAKTSAVVHRLSEELAVSIYNATGSKSPVERIILGKPQLVKSERQGRWEVHLAITMTLTEENGGILILENLEQMPAEVADLFAKLLVSHRHRKPSSHPRFLLLTHDLGLTANENCRMEDHPESAFESLRSAWVEEQLWDEEEAQDICFQLRKWAKPILIKLF